jgi:hypothetical protein
VLNHKILVKPMAGDQSVHIHNGIDNIRIIFYHFYFASNISLLPPTNCSCSVCTVLLVPLCLSSSGCPVLPVQFFLSCFFCPVLPRPFLMSCSACSVLSSSSACPVLPVPFCLSCYGICIHIYPVLIFLSRSTCPVLHVLF